VSRATHKPPTLEDRLTQEEFRARFEAEKVEVARHYCVLFRLWRRCPSKPCRRDRACVGDAVACLRRGARAVPREAQFAARQKLLQATPRHLAAPERAARDIMPSGFGDSSAAFRPQDIPAGWMRAGARPPRRRAKRTSGTAKLTPYAPSAQKYSP
jgi:hypothetical protein